MRRPALFILVNIIVSIIVVLVVVNVLNQRNGTASETPMVVTVPVLITTTPNASEPQVIVVTATPGPGIVILPTGIIGEIQLSSTRGPVPTIDQTIVATTGAGDAFAAAQSSLPENCIPHPLAEGEFPSLVAEQYGVTMEDLLAVNNLTEDTSRFLQIGDILIVPLEGCSLTAESVSATQTATFQPSSTPTSIPTETPVLPTSTASPQPSATATSTLPPTAENARVAIIAVRDPGTVTSELVELRNNDTAVVDLTGWKLQDADGNEYLFPAQRRLFGGGSVSLFSRVGEDTAIALFWDRQQSAFTRGEVITLFDNQGRAQSTFTVP